MEKTYLPQLDSSLFSWEKWEAGSIFEVFGFHCRYDNFIREKHTIKKYAIGYCNGESLICRPKENAIAVMYDKNGRVFWSHMTKQEFNEVFNV